MATLSSDPYEILGVARNAQLPEIRSAHRKLILKCHPDKIQDPQLKAEKEAEFHRVQQAYELLSDEVARSKYDRKEMEKANMSSSPPSARMSSRAKPHFEAEIRTAEPRPSTFAKTRASPSASKVYGAGYSASRSYEDELGGSSSRGFEDIRRAKKSASYSTSYERAERDRDREREREREQRERDREWEEELSRAARDKHRREEERRKRRDDELARERVKQEIKAQKEALREAEEKRKKERKDKEKDKKKADKERKKEAEEKHRRHKVPYAEHYHGDSESEDVTPHVSEKKSGSRKLDEAEQAAAAATERERKNSANLESAIRYLERSGSHATPTGRSPPYAEGTQFRHVQAPLAAAPTPPPAISAVHPPPPMPRDNEDEDPVRRSGRSGRAKPPDALRSSTKDKSRRSNSRSASKEGARIVEVGRTPSDRSPPKLNKSYSDPPKIVRSYTESYARPMPQPIPTLDRQNTWQGEDRYGGRGRRMASFEEESGDDDIYARNRRMQSPEPMTTAQTTYRYSVSDGKSRRKYTEPVPIPSRSRKPKHASANTSIPRADPAAAGMYYADEYADTPSHPAFEKVKYAPVVNADEVQYSSVPRYPSSYGKEAYAAQAY